MPPVPFGAAAALGSLPSVALSSATAPASVLSSAGGRKAINPPLERSANRFAAQGLAGIVQDAPRPGRKPKLPVALVRRVVQATLETTPPNATHWSVRTMAEAQGISRMAVQRIWQTHDLKPHLHRDLQTEHRSALCREGGGCRRPLPGPAGPRLGPVR